MLSASFSVPKFWSQSRPCCQQRTGNMTISCYDMRRLVSTSESRYTQGRPSLRPCSRCSRRGASAVKEPQVVMLRKLCYANSKYIIYITRWPYCVECPQYSTRLEALGCMCDCLSGRVQRQQVFNVMCHKAHRRRRWIVQCYSTGDGNMSSHEGTLAPPGEYD